MMQNLLAKFDNLVDLLEQLSLSLMPHYRRAPERAELRIQPNNLRALEVLFQQEREAQALTRRLPHTSILNRRRC